MGTEEAFMVAEDVCYTREYVSLYLNAEDSIFSFCYAENEKTFSNIAIKRPIRQIGNCPVSGYYDLESAYGYGGICVNAKSVSFLKRALKEYEEYCLQECIISEFMRFHPYNEMYLALPDYFDFLVKDREVVCVDTSVEREVRWQGYSSKVRNILKKCKRDLFVRRSNSVDSFMDLYAATMDKNNASSYYYFDERYFKSLLALENVDLYEVLYEGVVISASFFMFSEDFGHYHLSANNYKFRKHNANYLVLDSAFDRAHERGVGRVILGGGRTNSVDDSLFSFKQKFSDKKMPFYIAGKIYNEKVYRQYNCMWQEQSKEDVNFFLKYRQEIG